jgi:hypothetical protein
MRQHPPVPEPVRTLRATRGSTGESGEVDADLTAVVDAWPELPEAIKAGIVAMIRAARP